jgi:hypothetical protein
MMAIANTGFVDVIAYYGDANSCTKFKMHPIDWKAAQKAPDAAKWSLSAQSGTVIDKSVVIANPMFGNPGNSPMYLTDKNGRYLESNYAVNSPGWGQKYPGPT